MQQLHETYRALQIIRTALYDACARHGVKILDERHDPPNPYYGQTASGILLAQDYSTLTEAHTPWGRLGFTGSTSSCVDACEQVTRELIERFDLILIHKGEYVQGLGQSADLYRVRRVGDVKLPPYEAHKSHKSWTGYDESRKSWEDCA